MTGPRPKHEVVDLFNALCDAVKRRPTVPHTEPESLDAWADRVLHTITDEEWRFHFEAARSRIPPDGDASRALLSRLDRIAGELGPECFVRLEELARGVRRRTNAGVGGCSERRLVLPDYGANYMLETRIGDEVVCADEMAGLVLTPLGRAVLARKAAQR
jgi:hypothetical protein